MRTAFVLLALFIYIFVLALPAPAQEPPLLTEATVAALAGELSGETAKRNLEYISRHHRMRASSGFRSAAEFIAARAREYGLSGVEILQFPADGRSFYGTQKARPAWEAEFAELWELQKENGEWTRAARLGSWDAIPLTLAQDSESAEVTTDLVDCGTGTSDADYAGKDVRGKICLVEAQPGAAMPLAVEKYGAVGMVSYAQNQRQAWWGEDENLIRWGHLDSFTETKTFAFMVSLKQARRFRQRLAQGERIRLEAVVRAGRRPGNYDVVTATIPGAHPDLRQREIVYSCHLDHPRPGANDNASGCVTILEVGRAMAKLIREGRIEAPARTIRFVWPPEIEGTLALLNTRPDLAERFDAVIHMDMVGGGPETKAVFHVTRSPASLPTFINDIAETLAEFVNEQSYQFAATGAARFPLVAPEGGKEPLGARMAPFSMGSDHEVYTDSSWSIPAIYLNDWPDRYIHTNFDLPANIDPTKLLRAGFIGAASGYFLAQMQDEEDAAEALLAIAPRRMQRIARLANRRLEIAAEETGNLVGFFVNWELELVRSINRFVPGSMDEVEPLEDFLLGLAASLGTAGTQPPQGEGAVVLARNPEIKGPMSVFGYDYFADHCREHSVCNPGLLRHRGLWGSGGVYAYEVLNLADGRRTVQAIRDAVSASYGPVPLELVLEYLRALEAIGVVREVR
jgi:aminopeptidase YwaD